MNVNNIEYDKSNYLDIINYINDNRLNIFEHKDKNDKTIFQYLYSFGYYTLKYIKILEYYNYNFNLLNLKIFEHIDDVSFNYLFDNKLFNFDNIDPVILLNNGYNYNEDILTKIINYYNYEVNKIDDNGCTLHSKLYFYIHNEFNYPKYLIEKYKLYPTIKDFEYITLSEYIDLFYNNNKDLSIYNNNIIYKLCKNVFYYMENNIEKIEYYFKYLNLDEVNNFKKLNLIYEIHREIILDSKFNKLNKEVKKYLLELSEKILYNIDNNDIKQYINFYIKNQICYIHNLKGYIILKIICTYYNKDFNDYIDVGWARHVYDIFEECIPNDYQKDEFICNILKYYDII